jgi:hypothetical protein
VFNMNYIYELPFFRTSERLHGHVLGGWQASGIITVYSGVPFSATTSNFDAAGLGLINANPQRVRTCCAIPMPMLRTGCSG